MFTQNKPSHFFLLFIFPPVCYYFPMKEFTSCKGAMQSCLDTKTFAIAHLYKEEKPMEMHIHDCYEIYYSISGGRQFLIDNSFYPIKPGDIFLINQYEPHYLTQIEACVHERIVISVHPDYVKTLSRGDTCLDDCFRKRGPGFSHRLSLSKDKQREFLYLINKITSTEDYAHEIMEAAAFSELLVLLNKLSKGHPAANAGDAPTLTAYNPEVNEIISYINRNISSPIKIKDLADTFHLSESYVCRIFKSATGTTVNKYITARRISIAKSYLGNGMNVSEAYEQTGFSDYSSFFKAFTKAVGMSPKKYEQCTNK